MKKIIIVALLAFAACGNVIAAGGLKVGFVSLNRVLTEAPQVEAVNTAMIERFGGKKQELEDLNAEIKMMNENYKRNELVMTEDKLKELQAKLIAKMQNFKKKEATLSQEVKVMRSQELAVLRKSVRDIINKIAEKDNYDLVLSEGVVFAKDDMDITEAVLEKLKAEFKK